MLPGKPPRPKTREDFEIAIVCALTLEADAVLALFDHHWDEDNGISFRKALGDPNAYSTGVIGRHNVVLAHLPSMGKAAAGNIAASCRMSFPRINLALVVGVCGGAPLFEGGQILLGDVIISTGVVQYDLGRRFPDKFEMKDTLSESLGRPSLEVRSLLSKLRTARQHGRLQVVTRSYLDQTVRDATGALSNRKRSLDVLFPAHYRHKHQNPSACAICATCNESTDPVCEMASKSTCEDLGCDLAQRLPRTRLATMEKDQDEKKEQDVNLAVHFGTFASGDTVMKSGLDRDQLTVNNNVIGFEMESVGVWDVFPCVVIKGVCDYADSHKNKDWQSYAAASAAACTKAFLAHWDSMAQEFRAEAESKQLQKSIMESLRFPEMNARLNSIASETPSTFGWIFDSRYETSNQQQRMSIKREASSELEEDQDRLSEWNSHGPKKRKVDSTNSNEFQAGELGETQEELTSKSSDTSVRDLYEEASDSVASEYGTLHFNTDEKMPQPGVDWDSFEDWLTSDQPIYWVSGKPGSGKSTLIKFLLKHPKTIQYLRKWNQDTALLSYLFWKPGTPMQQSFKGFLCSLLFQLLSKDIGLVDSFKSMPELSHKMSPSDWDENELFNVLQCYCRDSARPLCLFVDALDEALEENTPDLLKFIKGLSPNIKICVSSRPERTFQLAFKGDPSMEMQKLTKLDILECSKSLMVNSTLLQSQAHDFSELAWEVAQAAEGIFLWAILVTRSLVRGINNGDPKHVIFRRLGSMPKGLQDLYRDLLSRTAEDRSIYRQYVSMAINLIFLSSARVTMSWMTYSKVSVFEVAMAMDPYLLDSYVVDGDEITDYEIENKVQNMRNVLDAGCAGLFEIAPDPDTPRPRHATFDILHFTHRAAQEFLLDTSEGLGFWKPCDISQQELHTRSFKAILAKCRFSHNIEHADVDIRDPQTLLRMLREWEKAQGFPKEATSSMLELAEMNYKRGFLCYTERDRSNEVLPRCVKGQFLTAAAACQHYRYCFYHLGRLQQSEAQETAYCILFKLCRLTIPTDAHASLTPRLEQIRYLLDKGYSPNWAITMSKGNRGFGSPWFWFLVTSLHELEALSPYRSISSLEFVILDVIYMFLNAGASMASTFPVVFRSPYDKFSPMGLGLAELIPHPEDSTEPFIFHFTVIEMNARALVELIMNRLHQTSDPAVLPSFSEPKPFMRALAFTDRKDVLLSIVETEADSELLVEATKMHFPRKLDKDDVSGQLQVARKACRDAMDQLKPRCRLATGSYYWKGARLWPCEIPMKCN